MYGRKLCLHENMEEVLEVNSKEIQKGVNLISIPSSQYKTNLISLYIKRPLAKEEVTMNSLIPYILRAGSKKYETQSAMVRALQNLYGSSIGVSVSKVGEKQILSFKLAYTDEQYLDEKISSDVLDILMDMVFHPYLEDGGFKQSIVDLEKDTLREAIYAKINNKASYAMEKMVESMCEGEPFSIPEDGFLDDLDKIDGKNLYAHYKKVIATSEFDVVIAGNVDEAAVKNAIAKQMGSRSDIIKLEREKIYHEPKEVKEVIEKLQVNQGKIVLGYRTNIGVEDELNIPLTLYSVILGAGTTSKLFMNVREKHSLSYSIGAGLERMKSLMYIQAGIEVTDFERAKKLIFAEVDDMKAGNISDNEFENAKRYIINQIRSVSDSISAVSDYIYMLSLKGMNETPETVIEKLQRVTLAEVVEVAQKVKLDTIYFLTSNEVVNE